MWSCDQSLATSISMRKVVITSGCKDLTCICLSYTFLYKIQEIFEEVQYFYFRRFPASKCFTVIFYETFLPANATRMCVCVCVCVCVWVCVCVCACVPACMHVRTCMPACVCVCVCVRACVCVCVYIYILSPWRLLPSAKCPRHTWGYGSAILCCEY